MWKLLAELAPQAAGSLGDLMREGLDGERHIIYFAATGIQGGVRQRQVISYIAS